MDKIYLAHHGIKGMKWGRRRYQNPDGSLTPAGQKRYGNIHSDYERAHNGKKISEMSDVELRARNNRLQMEKQYADLTRRTNKGKKAVQAFIASGATVAGVMTAVAAYQKLGKKVMATDTAGKVLDKIGDMVIKSINLSGPLH